MTSPFYETGTITVTEDSATVTGSGTAWSSALIRVGDTLVVFRTDNQPAHIPIASVDSDTQITLKHAWQEATAAGASYLIERRFNTERLADLARIYNQFNEKLLSGFGIRPNAVGTYAQRADYDDVDPADYDGGVFIYAATTDAGGDDLPGYWNLYSKLSSSSGDWSTAAKSAGADGQAVNHNVDGVPGSGLGDDGDTAININTGDIYYKSGGSWALTFNLIGPTSDMKRQFSTTTTMADPTAGYLRFNHATFASITALAISQSDARSGNPDFSAFIDTWDDQTSTIKGHLFVQSLATPSKFSIFAVTGLTDNTDWYQLAVTPVASTGTLSNDESVAVQFLRTGDKGDEGYVPGFGMAFDSAIDDEDPGAGDFRFDNATFGSITQAFVDAVDENGNDTLNTLDYLIGAAANNASYATMFVFKQSDFGAVKIFDVNGITSATGYRKLSLTPIAENGTISNGDACFVLFAPKAAPQAPLLYQLDLASTTDSDPGSGQLRANHGTFGSITELFLDNEKWGGADVSAGIDALLSGNGTTKADLFVCKYGNPAIYWQFRVTAFEDSTGYRTLTVTPVDNAGSFADGDLVALAITPRGNDSYQPGYHLKWDLAATADADPGAAYVRPNNADPTLATALYINDEDIFGGAIATWLEEIGSANAATTRARLRFEKLLDPSVYVEYRVQAQPVDGTGYWKLTVSVIASAGSFSDEDRLIANDFRSGDNGAAHGYQFKLDLASTLDADPTSGYIRWNNADKELVTELFMSGNTADAADASGWIETFDDSTNSSHRGTIKLQKKGDPSVYVEYAVTADVESASTYYRITVEYVTHGGALSDEDDIIVTWARTGDGFVPVGSKGVPIDADSTYIIDSADGDQLKTATFQDYRSALLGSGVTGLNGLPFSGVNNRFRNPAFVVDQRGNAGGVTASLTHVVDGWVRDGSNGVTTMTLSRTDGDEGIYALKNEVTTGNDTSIAAGDYEVVLTAVEGFNVADAKWGTADAEDLYLSLRFYAPSTATYCIALRNGATDRSYVFEVAATADTWIDVTKTIPGDTSGTWLKTTGTGLTVVVTMAAGSTFQTTPDTWAAGNYFATSNQANGLATNGKSMRIEKPMLSVGGGPFTFEHLPIAAEELMCRRYYRRGIAWGTQRSTTLAHCFADAQGMRVSPTIAYESGIQVPTIYGFGPLASPSVTPGYASGAAALSVTNTATGGGSDPVYAGYSASAEMI